MIRATFAIIAVAVTLVAWCAGAAPPRPVGTLTQTMSPRVSRCLIRREPELVDRWLATLPGSKAERLLIRTSETRFDGCFGVVGSDWTPDYDAAGIRAALIRARLQARRDTLPETLPAVAMAWYLTRSDTTATDAAAVTSAAVGRCLALEHWRSVLALIRAVDPDVERMDFVIVTRAEWARRREAAAADAALNEIVPAIAACVPAGTTLRLDRPTLRRIVEEAAFHLLPAPDATMAIAPAG